jgi:hypothetical protein
MAIKKVLRKLSRNQQEYFMFLAKECFSGFRNAEDNFTVYRYASCNTWLFHCSEFFWKALTILSDNYFGIKHEVSQEDMSKISKDLLSNEERIKAFRILSGFPDIARELARYGYYERKKTETNFPTILFGREDTQTNLNEVGWLINKLREIYYYQIFEPPIRIGILSGYIESRKEKPCSYYPHSQYRKAVQWMLYLNNIKYDKSNLFQASLTPTSNLTNEALSIIINPFGEAYPELDKAEGTGFKTILSYIRDGGIFVNSGGQPFAYSWDVNTGNYRLLVNFLPVSTDVESCYVEGKPVLSVKEASSLSPENLLLKRYFDVKTLWDNLEANIVGPQEIEIEFNESLGSDKPKTKAMVYRPVQELSDNIIPLAHSCNNQIWNNVYPVVAIKFGRGFLIHSGMSLDNEREYKILLDIIRRLGTIGYEVFAKSS